MKTAKNGWTRERRARYKATIAARNHRSSLVHTPTNLDKSPVAKKCLVPMEIRDVDSIFGRFSRLTYNAKMFVAQNIMQSLALATGEKEVS